MRSFDTVLLLMLVGGSAAFGGILLLCSVFCHWSPAPGDHPPSAEEDKFTAAVGGFILGSGMVMCIATAFI